MWVGKYVKPESNQHEKNVNISKTKLTYLIMGRILSFEAKTNTNYNIFWRTLKAFCNTNTK